MKKVFALILLISITMPACFKKKCTTATSKKATSANKKNGQLFSEDAEEFVLEDDSNVNVFESDNASSENEEISLDGLQEKPLERGKTIQFDYNSSKIRPEQTTKITQNASLVKDKLKQNKNSKVVCKGHSCKIAKNKEYNYTLSQERAHRIAKNYEKQGVAANRIKAVGFGDSNRITEAEGIVGQAPNRRVETELLVD